MPRMLILAVFFLMVGCTTYRSPALEAEGQQFLFQTDDEEAIFRAAYEALMDKENATGVLEGKNNATIQELTGPIRGYQVSRVIIMDRWNVKLSVIPATGIDSKGELISGYYPEVDGSGYAPFHANSINSDVYRKALEKFSSVGNKVYVRQLQRGQYRLQRDAWRLSDAPSLREGGTIKFEAVMPRGSSSSKSVEQRLQDLDALKRKGLVSEDEYQRSRRKILDDL